MDKMIVAKYGLEHTLDMCCEECGELIRACVKYKRASGIGYITPVSKQEATNNLIEEMADVVNTIGAVSYLLGVPRIRISDAIKEADEKTRERWLRKHSKDLDGRKKIIRFSKGKQKDSAELKMN